MITIIFGCGITSNYSKEFLVKLIPCFSNIPDNGTIDFKQNAPFITYQNFIIASGFSNKNIINSDTINQTFNFLQLKNNWIEKEFMNKIHEYNPQNCIVNVNIEYLKIYLNVFPHYFSIYFTTILECCDLSDIKQIIKPIHLKQQGFYSLFDIILKNVIFFPCCSIEFMNKINTKKYIFFEYLITDMNLDIHSHEYILRNDYPLWRAIYNNNFEAAKILLKYGANINYKDNLQNTLFHIPCSMSFYTMEQIQFAINNKYDINAINQSGLTPLFNWILFFRNDGYEPEDDPDDYDNTIIKIGNMIKSFITMGSDSSLMYKNRNINFYIKKIISKYPGLGQTIHDNILI
jgi:hypothetical protein